MDASGSPTRIRMPSSSKTALFSPSPSDSSPYRLSHQRFDLLAVYLFLFQEQLGALFQIQTIVRLSQSTVAIFFLFWHEHNR
jgi:hypothetical protein